MRFELPIIPDAHFRKDARQADRLRSVDQIIDENITRHVAAWAIPGDLFDGITDPQTRLDWYTRVRRMSDHAPVIICTGNHDQPGELTPMTFIASKFPVFVADTPTTVVVRRWGIFDATRVDYELHVFVFPYPHRAGLVADSVAPGDLAQAARPLLDAIFMEHGAKLDAARAKGHATMMIGHANVAGSIMGNGQPLIGQEVELDTQLLARLGHIPKVLNHIHKAQDVGDAVLTGSVTAMSWGETDEKRYVRVVFESTPTNAWDWRIESVPLTTPKLHLVEMSLTGDVRTLVSGPVSVGDTDHVRVRVRFKDVDRGFYGLHRNEIARIYGNSARLDIEPICEVETGLRSEAVASAKTLHDKVAAWADSAGLALPEDLSSALSALETQPHERVVTEFTARLLGLVDGI